MKLFNGKVVIENEYFEFFGRAWQLVMEPSWTSSYGYIDYWKRVEPRVDTPKPTAKKRQNKSTKKSKGKSK